MKSVEGISPRGKESMRVASLNLANYRIFKTLALEDFKGLNVFIGPNASGKSTALQALDVLLEYSGMAFSRETPFRASTAEQVRLSSDVRLEAGETEAVVRRFAQIHNRPQPQPGILEQIVKALAVNVRFRYSAIAPSDGTSVSVNKQYLVGEQELDGYLFQGKLTQEARMLGASGIDLSGNIGPNIGAGVSVRTVYLPVSRNLPQRFGATQPQKGRPEELGQWVLRERVEKLPGFDRYEKLISGILPHVKGLLLNPGAGDFQLGLAESELPGMTPAMGWSSGTSHLAMFLGALASLGPGSVVLAEEPELSLHPGALRQLMHEIRRLADARQIQFFLTTHSDVVVEQLEPETSGHSLWRFARNDDGSASATRCQTDKEVDEAIASLRMR